MILGSVSRFDVPRVCRVSCSDEGIGTPAVAPRLDVILRDWVIAGLVLVPMSSPHEENTAGADGAAGASHGSHQGPPSSGAATSTAGVASAGGAGGGLSTSLLQALLSVDASADNAQQQLAALQQQAMALLLAQQQQQQQQKQQQMPPTNQSAAPTSPPPPVSAPAAPQTPLTHLPQPVQPPANSTTIPDASLVPTAPAPVLCPSLQLPPPPAAAGAGGGGGAAAAAPELSAAATAVMAASPAAITPVSGVPSSDRDGTASGDDAAAAVPPPPSWWLPQTPSMPGVCMLPNPAQSSLPVAPTLPHALPVVAVPPHVHMDQAPHVMPLPPAPTSPSATTRPSSGANDLLASPQAPTRPAFSLVRHVVPHASSRRPHGPPPPLFGGTQRTDPNALTERLQEEVARRQEAEAKVGLGWGHGGHARCASHLCGWVCFTPDPLVLSCVCGGSCVQLAELETSLQFLTSRSDAQSEASFVSASTSRSFRVPLAPRHVRVHLGVLHASPLVCVALLMQFALLPTLLRGRRELTIGVYAFIACDVAAPLSPWWFNFLLCVRLRRLCTLRVNRFKRRQGGRAVYVPVETLDFDEEKRLILDTLRQARRAVRISVKVATADSLRMLLDDGCTAIHFTGHGGIDKVCGVLSVCVCEGVFGPFWGVVRGMWHFVL